jgi:hypothetical protein
MTHPFGFHGSFPGGNRPFVVSPVGDMTTGHSNKGRIWACTQTRGDRVPIFTDC